MKKQSSDSMLHIATFRVSGIKERGMVYISRAELIGWLAECELGSTDATAKKTINEIRNALKGSWEEEV